MSNIFKHPRILMAPGVDVLHAHALHASQSESISELLNKKNFKPHDSQLSYRVLNDWTDK